MIKRLISLLVICSGCTVYNINSHYLTYSDKLENVVIVGFGAPPLYAEYTPDNIDFYLAERGKYLPTFNVGDTIKFWTYAIFMDNYYKPITNLKIKIDVVKSTGDEYIPKYITSWVVTNDSGYNSLPVKLVINDSFTYRLRVTYKDKNTTTISYSPNFLIRNGT